MTQENERDHREDLFAATPPLEAKNMSLSLAATEGGGRYEEGRTGEGMYLDFMDIRKACFHADARGDVHVDLPRGNAAEDKCCNLRKSSYGT